MLVTIAGTMTMASAWAGGIDTASTPIATVGRPSPRAPLTNPASSRAVAMKGSVESNMPATLTDRDYRHNLEITETAFGQAEGKMPPPSLRGAKRRSNDGFVNGIARKPDAFRSGRSSALHRGGGDAQHHQRRGAGSSRAGLGE